MGWVENIGSMDDPLPSPSDGIRTNIAVSHSATFP